LFAANNRGCFYYHEVELGRCLALRSTNSKPNDTNPRGDRFATVGLLNRNTNAADISANVTKKQLGRHL
jgi:hypothetical protein